MVQLTFSAARPEPPVLYAREELTRYLTRMLAGATAAIEVELDVQPPPHPAPPVALWAGFLVCFGAFCLFQFIFH